SRSASAGRHHLGRRPPARRRRTTSGGRRTGHGGPAQAVRADPDHLARGGSVELNAAQRYVVSRDELAPATPITQGAAALTVLVPLVAWAVMGRWPLLLALAVPAALVIG